MGWWRLESAICRNTRRLITIVKTTEFFPWAKPASVLGYGTTSFMSAPSTQERIGLLEAAFDAGITHFDTAAYYGYGEAERLVGTCFSGRRDKVTITTKFGIEPTGAAKYRWVNLAARRIFSFAPAVKKLFRRTGTAGSSWGVFDPARAEASLDRSLAALRTDYVDLFLMHEPSPGSASSEPLLEFLDKEMVRGRIRGYGCGGEWESIRQIAASGGRSSKWLQFEDNALNRRIEEVKLCGAKCITFAPFNSALQSLVYFLERNPGRRDEWSKALDLDCRDRDCLASLLQASCHARNPSGIVLFSSKSVERIRKAVWISDGKSFSDEQVSRFLELTLEVAPATGPS
jgi:D-threo-aldose 1-dehydrogenase